MTAAPGELADEPVPVLLVEDPHRRPAMEALLAGPGVCLQRAGSAEEALQRLDQGRFAVVVLRGPNGGPGGFETVQRLRSRDRDRPTPVLFISSDAQFPEARAYALGTVDHLVEPFAPEALRAKVGVFVDLYRAAERVCRLERPAVDGGRRERAAHAIALILAEAADAPDAVRRVLRTLADQFGWDVGGLWAAGEGGALRLSEWWAAGPVPVPQFESASRAATFPPGIGVPGRVWANREPTWVADLAGETNFPRRREAAADGLASGAAVPVRAAGEFLGVIEFYSRRPRAPDPQVLSELAAAGAAVGHFLRRRRTEAALRESEQRFARFMAGLPGLAWVKDPDGRYVYVNEAAARAFGRRGEALYGRTDAELFPPETAARFRENDGRALTEPGGVQVVETLRHSDGRVHHSVVSKFPVPAPGGRPAVGGVAIDITDRMRAEAALDRYRLLSQHARDIVLFIRPSDGRIVEANAAAAAAYGYDRDTLLTLTIADLRDPATVPLVSRQIAEADGRGATFETTHRRRDGTTFPVEVSSSGADVGGERLLLSIVRDVSERKAAEAAVRRSEARYRKLVEESPLSIQILAPDGRTLGVNRAWERLWGGTLAEHLGDYNLRTDPQLKAVGLAPLIERAFTGEAVELPPVGYSPDRGLFAGQERWVRAFMYPVKDAAGRVEEVVLIHEDITGRRQAEEALKEADQRKDEFLVMLAHELRNPLAPIRNAAQVLRLFGQGEPRLLEVRDLIDRQVGHLSRLVEDLLDVARIVRGKLQLRPERLDLARLARDGVADHRPAFAQKRVTLRAEAPDTPVWVRGDETRLAQVLDNLLTNALKFTPAGGAVTVTVTAHPAGRATLAVRDSGAGIDPDLRARLFQPFSQGDRTLDRSQGGLGLGLAIVTGVVELHQGRVRVDSGGPGTGATFTVELPAEVEPAALSGSAAAPVPAPKGLRVLVVEDNRDAADSLKMLLEAFGYPATVAYTGPDGVRAAEEHRPDVVVCDIGLPGLDGYGVATALRRNPHTAAARLIALTGYGRDEDRRRASEAGFDHHLTKPADPATLLRLFTDNPAGATKG